MNNKFIAVQLLTLGNQFVKADLPIHCLGEDRLGKWNFHVSTDVQNVNLYETTEVCTHDLPNRMQIMNEGYNFHFQKDAIYKMDFKPDNVIEAQICQGTDCGDSISGSWLAFYDQGFKVELSNGQRFLTNYKYAVKEGIATDPLDLGRQGMKALNELKTDDYGKFYS